MATSSKPTGVLLMTYGSATTSANVDDFIEHVYPKQPAPELIAEFKRRFDIVHSSPLIAITIEQGKALQKLLEERHGKNTFVVRAGMLHSAPFIADSVAELRSLGAASITGIILSPQFSDFIMSGYKRYLLEAAADNGYTAADVRIVGPWPDEPRYVQFISQNLVKKRKVLSEKYGAAVPVIFTTHSLPERVVAKDPNYLKQLEITMHAVVAKSKLPDGSWTYAYQSAGHSPEPWLKPDLVDILAEYKTRKKPAVLIVPLQFLADHLEVLYDLDTAAREQCTASGIAYNRIELPNTAPLFIQSLANLAAGRE